MSGAVEAVPAPAQPFRATHLTIWYVQWFKNYNHNHVNSTDNTNIKHVKSKLY